MPGWIYLLVALAVTAATANFIRRIRALQSQDRDRAADVSRTTPLGMEATSQARFDLENRAATFGGTGNAVSSCNDTLDQAVSRTWALAARLNPPQHHSHMTGRASATNLVKGIAQMNPVTLFLATSIDMASEDDQILININRHGPITHIPRLDADRLARQHVHAQASDAQAVVLLGQGTAEHLVDRASAEHAGRGFDIGVGVGDGRDVFEFDWPGEGAIDTGASGIGDHVVQSNGVDELRKITTCVAQGLTEGGTVTSPAYDHEMPDAT